MRRNDVLPASARHLAGPVVLGSIALSLSGFPGEPEHDRDLETVPPVRVHGSVTPDEREAVSRVGVPAAGTAVRTHVVAVGDTVSAIAAAHGVRTVDVLAWNDLSWRSVIHPGDVLRLGPAAERASASPRPSRAANTFTVASGDTLWSIAKRHKTTVSAIAEANGLGASTMIRPGQQLTLAPHVEAERAASSTPSPAPPTASRVHEVGAGQTLWAIAEKHSVTLDDLLEANGLDAGSIIYPGQRLRIPAGGTVSLDAEQVANVRTIIDVGRDRGVSRDGIAIALATAMVESWIRNLDWGDRDSLGLFQQRPSTGWGTPEQIRDTRRAAAAFFGGPSDPNRDSTRGLLDIAGWEQMEFGDAAQAVQVSAHPDRYGKWKKQAYRWLDLYG